MNRTKNKNIQIYTGDGIEIGREVKNLNHICCRCGLGHKIKIDWKKDSVIFKFKGLRNAV